MGIFETINSYTFSLLIGLPAIADYFLKEQAWYRFPVSFVVGTLVWYLTAFAVGFIESMAECRRKRGMKNAFVYATKISSTASILSNVLYFIPPFGLMWPILGAIPYLGYFTNGLVLNLGFKVAGWFMRC